MVKIGFDMYLIFYTAAFALILLIVWVQEAWRHKRENWILSQEQLCHCRGCNLTFLSRRVETVSPCPGCRDGIRIRVRKNTRRIRYEPAERNSAA